MPSLLSNPYSRLHLYALIQWHQYLPYVQGKNSGAILCAFLMLYNIPQCPTCNQSLHIDWLHFRLMITKFQRALCNPTKILSFASRFTLSPR